MTRFASSSSVLPPESWRFAGARREGLPAPAVKAKPAISGTSSPYPPHRLVLHRPMAHALRTHEAVADTSHIFFTGKMAPQWQNGQTPERKEREA
jgi:hypothetical protein